MQPGWTCSSGSSLCGRRWWEHSLLVAHRHQAPVLSERRSTHHASGCSAWTAAFQGRTRPPTVLPIDAADNREFPGTVWVECQHRYHSEVLSCQPRRWELQLADREPHGRRHFSADDDETAQAQFLMLGSVRRAALLLIGARDSLPASSPTITERISRAYPPQAYRGWTGIRHASRV